jgi:uncharacterized protein with HEPN domain
MRQLRERLEDILRINQEIVWETVEKHLPALKTEVEQILGQLPPE